MRVLHRIAVLCKLRYVLVCIKLRHLHVWHSWSGWGVTTNWPKESYVNEVLWLTSLIDVHLGEDYVIHGPTTSAGGKTIVYFWPNNDPQAIRHMLENGPDKAPANDTQANAA
ncbi:MAG: hypothetical protein WC766_00340 [Patescibacteria group bacterium]|jgi:hypothetical protein